MTVDILAFGAHPDDAEIGCGGLLLKMKDRGYRTGIVYLTVGEMGSRGTPQVRRQELTAAAEVLGLDHVEVMDFQDCRVLDDFESRLKIARAVRQQRPRIVLAPYWDGPPGRGVGHTDHQTTGYLVSHGVNFAHLQALPLEGEPHSVSNILCFCIPENVALICRGHLGIHRSVGGSVEMPPLTVPQHRDGAMTLLIRSLPSPTLVAYRSRADTHKGSLRLSH